MDVKITPFTESTEYYIIPFAKTKSDFVELCIKFEIESIKLNTYECIREFLIYKDMHSTDTGYIISDKFAGDYKDKQSFKVQIKNELCVIHKITI